MCGTKDTKFHIHHIDYDKKNSVEMNLITLCAKCHSKTNYKRDNWKTYFKPIMEEKYKTEETNV